MSPFLFHCDITVIEIFEPLIYDNMDNIFNKKNQTLYTSKSFRRIFQIVNCRFDIKKNIVSNVLILVDLHGTNYNSLCSYDIGYLAIVTQERNSSTQYTTICKTCTYGRGNLLLEMIDYETTMKGRICWPPVLDCNRMIPWTVPHFREL